MNEKRLNDNSRCHKKRKRLLSDAFFFINTSVKIYRSIVTFNISIMSRKNKNQTNIWIAIDIWIAIEAIFLIILLIIWLTVADFTGDTDVAAFIAPAFSGLTFLKL